MSGIDISPEISGFKASASQYFPCDFKLPSEVSHLFALSTEEKGLQLQCCVRGTALHQRLKDKAWGDHSC